MKTHAEKHVSRVNFWFLAAYWAHLPVFLAVAHFRGGDLREAAALALLGAAGPVLAHRFKPGSGLSAVITGVGGMVLSAGLIHLGGGMIEMHFHVFVLLPLLAVFGRFLVVLAAAAAIAVHHVAFYFYLPASLFNYDASFWVVVLHAVFVILAAVPGAIIARLINAYVVGAGAAVEELGETSGELKATADEFAAASGTMAEEVNKQAGLTQRSAETLRGLMTGLKDSSARLGAVRGGELPRMQVEIAQLTEEGQAMTASMQAAREAGASVGGIVRAIEEIAFQTNILALNAAIEAARAGAAGASFAVVAEEVRALAARAAEAARETGSLITQVTTGVAKSEETGVRVAERLARLGGVFTELDGVVRGVGENVDGQTSGLDEIGRAMDELDQAALAGGARSEELASSAQMLKQQAGRVAAALVSLQAATKSGGARKAGPTVA